MRDICKACVIYVYIMQVHKYTHSQYVCSSCCAIMLDPSYFHSFVCADLHCWMCIYVRTFPLTSQNMLIFCIALFFKRVDRHLHFHHRIILHCSVSSTGSSDYAESRPDNAASAGKGQDEKFRARVANLGEAWRVSECCLQLRNEDTRKWRVKKTSLGMESQDPSQ